MEPSFEMESLINILIEETDLAAFIGCERCPRLSIKRLLKRFPEEEVWRRVSEQAVLHKEHIDLAREDFNQRESRRGLTERERNAIRCAMCRARFSELWRKIWPMDRSAFSITSERIVTGVEEFHRKGHVKAGQDRS